jgi:signal transduction histidine kinase
MADRDRGHVPQAGSGLYNWTVRADSVGGPLDPVVLRAFRTGVALQLGMSAVLAAVRPTALFYVPEGALVLAVLFWPGSRERLGRGYLPAVLTLAAGLAIVARQTALTERPLGPDLVAVALLVPTLVAAMQYGSRGVNAIVLGTAVVDSLLSLARLHGRLDGGGIGTVLTPIFLRTAMFAMGGYVGVYLHAVGRERRKALLRQNAQLARHAATVEQLATASERNRLARELHDTLAHTLSGLAVQLEAARSVWDTDPGDARALLDRSLAMARTGLTEARRALHALRASPLDDLRLPLALRQMAESAAARTGAALTVRTPNPGIRFQPEIEQSVYRVAQEALENVARHADARRISVALEQNGTHLQLTVSDDGRGFDPAAAGADGGLGVKGMRERAEMLGGSIEITSRPGGPTTLHLILPSSP